ncbi:MAG: ABC-2 family transporter protein [Planctomycetes bacterium]|nr:ABC-2 family transporter protein [Planctomycetota bacterium]
MTLPRAAVPVLAFARVAFTGLLAYRLRYVVGVVNYVIYMGVQYTLWAAVYASRPEGQAEIGGYGFRALVTYFAVGWIARVSCYNNIDRELADRVSQGDIALDLLRPVSLLQRGYGEALGEACMRVFFMALPTALIFFPAFGVEGPGFPPGTAGLAMAAAFGLSLVLAFHAFFLLNFLVGASTIFFEKIRGLLWTKFILIQLLSGLLVPFELFPSWARAILEALPFRAMVYGPVQIYLGKAQGAALVWELGLQVLWVAALYGLSRWLWARARRRLLVHGG